MEYETTRSSLNRSYTILLHPNLENAVVKIKENKAAEQTAVEENAVGFLKKHVVHEESQRKVGRVSLAERSLKRRRISCSSSNDYIYCRFLIPTSNFFERFFSQYKFTFTDLRRRMLPSNFEC